MDNVKTVYPLQTKFAGGIITQTVKTCGRPVRSGTICLLSSLIGSVVALWLVHLPLLLEVRGHFPACGKQKFRCPNTFSVVSFTGMTINKCAILRIRTLTGSPMCK